jgi:multidrug efflux pump subunit AcrB/ABC-type multidrug transport system ATPase subunit
MFFLGVVILGLIGWQRIPIELLPALSGDQLFVSFFRPGGEPELVEREILMPLEARVSEFPGVEETWGTIRGSAGTFQVRFAPGTELKVRELELRRLAAELARDQPEGTVIDVGARDLSFASRFVMLVEVSGGDDNNALRDVVEERIEPRLAAVPGVGRVLVTGGAAREMTVRVDPDRCAALGVSVIQVASALSRSVQRLRYVGGLEDRSGRTSILVDGRPRGVSSVGEIRVADGLPVLVRHVADVDVGPGREEVLFRVNGRPSVGLVVYQEEGANLVALGRSLRTRLDELREALAVYGIEFHIGADGADFVEQQVRRLKRLALSGFVIALVVLYLFLREPRAVGVVAVAVPVSLLAALAALYVAGYTLNLITLFGLAVGIGMLVDNSIVVYEAVQRQLERGAVPDVAATGGIRRTVRAITAASVTTAVVFLPVVFTTEEAVTRGLLELLAVSLLLPLAASLVVATGLVPLLARYLAAPAALARLADVRQRREAYRGLVKPDRGRELFSGVLKVALRRPAGWLAGVAAAVLVTVVVAVPWVAVGALNQEPPEADEVRLIVEVPRRGSLEAAAEVFDRLEQAVLALGGVDFVECVVQEEGGTLTVHLVDPEDRPATVSASRVRNLVRDAARGLDGVTVRAMESSGGGGGDGQDGGGDPFGQGPAEVVVSGPDARQLTELADSIVSRLESIPEVGDAWTSTVPGQDEVRVTPRRLALAAFGLSPDQVLPGLVSLRREGIVMRTGFTLESGREIPLVVRSLSARQASAGKAIEGLRLATPAGVVPLGAVASVRRMPPPPTILHHNGRREITVYYRLGSSAPQTGPARQELDEQIRAAVRDLHRPAGTTVEALGETESSSWFRRTLVPVLLLLLAVLAITFESLTVPVVVLLAVPLTVLGATWALVFAGHPAGLMALVGALALLGLTVNPAILLVDRMQRRVLRASWSAGAAALAAVRERARPVLMTSCTTVAGLWPLALVSGRENEIWPPFATVVMGGLITSTVLTLLVIPVGFVLLNRLDRLFGRVGPWVVLAWVGTTAAVMAPLILGEHITSLTWQTVTTLLVGAGLLGVAVLVLARRPVPQPDTADGPPVVEVRFLHKIYGRPGPIGRAWRSGERFAERVLARGGTPFVPADARERVLTLAVLVAGAGYLAFSVQTMWWRLVTSLALAWLLARLLTEIRRWRGGCDELGRVRRGGIEGTVAALVPWVVLTVLALRYTVLPRVAGERVVFTTFAVLVVAAVLLVVQLGRRTAARVADGTALERPGEGRLRRTRGAWRRWSRRLFGLDLPRHEVTGLGGIHFRAEQGMIGILGPNGAGKTTLLRLLTGILDPSVGRITIGGVPIPEVRRHLARWVGYLPQDFGLPGDLSAREYLEYYALLYQLGDTAERRQRVQSLLDEVGLAGRADDRIGGYSGGMRQRVAVARTLLRLPAVIVVDEPTVGLDPRERIRFRNLLGRLARGRVVLFSTHVVDDVAVACERVIVLAGGDVVFDGPPMRLAECAAGRVWEVHLHSDEQGSLPAEALVVDQVPEEDGRTRLRILSGSRPHRLAAPRQPTLEDGYLLLVGRHGGRRAA